jgi:hypothetical protein
MRSTVPSKAGWSRPTWCATTIRSSARPGPTPRLGEVAWQTSGTPGTSDYRTNGGRQLYTISGVAVAPIDALDAAGHSYTSQSFSGAVHTLVYNQNLPTDAYIGAWFLDYVTRISFSVSLADGSLSSNPLLVEMAVPSLVEDFPWFRLNDAVVGRLNQNQPGDGCVPQQNLARAPGLRRLADSAIPPLPEAKPGRSLGRNRQAGLALCRSTNLGVRPKPVGQGLEARRLWG